MGKRSEIPRVAGGIRNSGLEIAQPTPNPMQIIAIEEPERNNHYGGKKSFTRMHSYVIKSTPPCPSFGFPDMLLSNH